MSYFEREKTICDIFLRRFRNRKFKMLYEINTLGVSIIIKHKPFDWNEKKGRNYLNKLIKKNNLAYIGYRPRCLILKQNNTETEYFIPMQHFNIENYYSSDF